MREIAKQLRINASTVSREIRRNSTDNCYLVEDSDKKAKERRVQASSGSRKLVGWLKDQVIEWLKHHWSPDQISGRLKLEYGINISHESIYRLIRLDKKR